MKIFRNWKLWLLAAITGIATLTYSFVDNDFQIAKNLDIYFTLFRELNMYYVDQTDPEKLIKTSIDAMLETLDPYTVFIPESEMDDYKFITTGEYAGIGASILRNGNFISISEPYENSPAIRAGLKAGDNILEIDGKQLSKLNPSQINDLLKGDAGTRITMKILRPGNPEPFKKVLKRENITLKNVPYYGLSGPNTGYIKLANFTTNAYQEVKNALLDLKKQGANKIILDLRGNPGGLLVEAVGISGLFVGKGQEIVSTRGKVKEFDNTYVTQNEPVDTQIPLALLVNKNSASASEIVAGSLQDLDRAVIIGQRTFGKGLVQTTRPLSYNTRLKVTTAKYYIPSGRCIQALDYTHREADGTVDHIPDSLIRQFKTHNGRLVYDGGGISPDIKIPVETFSDLLINLYARNYIFNYSTLFAREHDTIGDPEKFEITTPVYDDFKNYLARENFDYKTEIENEFDKLADMARNDSMYDGAKQEFEALSAKISHHVQKELDMYRPEITDLLREEIASRYYLQRGRIAASIQTDPDVKKAMDILNSKTIYSGILDGSIKNQAAAR